MLNKIKVFNINNYVKKKHISNTDILDVLTHYT